MTNQLEKELKLRYGQDAAFRPDQERAILSVLQGKRTLVVEKTGWGKSLVYFLSTKMLRQQGGGFTIVISPLIALMSNQIEQAEKVGLVARTMNSNNRDDWEQIEEELVNDMVDILMISPEHLNNDEFRDNFLMKVAKSIGLFVVDEAHCISDWGHDFRPDYRRIVAILKLLPENVPVLATTATANDRVIEDIISQLGDNLEVIRGPLTRESLSIDVVRLGYKEERMAWIADNINKLEGTGIIYCLTKADCKLVEKWLIELGITCKRYDGDLNGEEREEIAGLFMANEIKVLVATTAFGMGVDKSDISFVIHFQKPANIVSYYQQIGRAGRGISSAKAILLTGFEDDDINTYFIESAFPTEKEMISIVDCCKRIVGPHRFEIAKETGLKQGKLEKSLKYLVVEGAIYKENGRYFKSANEWHPDLVKAELITQKRKNELERMNDYIHTDKCYMKFIAEELNDNTAIECWKCANCDEKMKFSRKVSKESLEHARYFLKHDYYTIEPRKQWPVGEKINGTNKIKEEMRMQPGLVLSNYSDCEYGRMVRECKYQRGEFSEELLEASCERLSKFIEEHNITWIAYIPSLNHPQLVKDFAQKIARYFQLPIKDAIIKVQNAVEQKTLTNSVQQFQNAYESFECTDTVLEGNVLLIDDMVDSRWTLTVCSYKLLEKGANEVYPFALSNTAGASGGA